MTAGQFPIAIAALAAAFADLPTVEQRGERGEQILAAMQFLKNPPERYVFPDMQIEHVDGDPRNNHLGNLRLVKKGDSS